MKTIDVHTHILPPSYLEALAELGIETQKEDGFPEPSWSVEDQLAFIEATDQAFQIVSISSPHPHRGDDELAARHARLINDETAAICKQYPDKFGFATFLPLPNVEASIEEAVRGYDELGAIGVKLPSNANGVYLGDVSLRPLYEVLNERDAVIIIHPTAPSAVPQGAFTAKVNPMYEFFTDTTRAVIDMMFNGVIEDYPDIRWIVPHCGAFLPEVAHRLIGISNILAPTGMMPKIDVMANIKSLYFDLAGVAQPVMLDALMKIAEPGHLLYGSDFPYTPVPMMKGMKDGLESDPLLDGILEDAFYNNAAKLFGLELA